MYVFSPSLIALILNSECESDCKECILSNTFLHLFDNSHSGFLMVFVFSDNFRINSIGIIFSVPLKM